MAGYRPPHRSLDDKRKGKATRLICCWCKKVEQIDGEWEKAGPVAAEEKIGHRCCPACDAKVRNGRPRSVRKQHLPRPEKQVRQ